MHDDTDDELEALFHECSNRGRWGADDERGTLNLIDEAVRLRALAQVRHGALVSLGLDLTTSASAKNVDPLVHRMLLDPPHPDAALDRIELAPHGFSVTHLDALGHVFWDGVAYNGRRAAAILADDGLRFGAITAAGDGVLTRGVLLDIAAVRGVPWLEPGDYVTPDDLDAAVELAGTTIEPGDAVFAHIGLARREAAEGEEDPSLRAGLHAECVRWLRRNDVAVWSGDCVERTPYPSAVLPLPLHQIGLASMGLHLLDCPDMDALHRACEAYGTRTFAVMMAPLRIPGGTGSPVNPIAMF